jgi:DNA-directed RNA polymerase specialized sigma24 family protein
MLKAVEGYSHDEIAAQLGIRRGTSEVRLYRAIRELRAFLGRT